MGEVVVGMGNVIEAWGLCVYYDVACGLNVHQRCERMVPCNCGINQVELAKMLTQMGVSPDRLNPKVMTIISIIILIMILLIVESSINKFKRRKW